MKRRKTVNVPDGQGGVADSVRRVFAAVLNRGRDDEPDLPAGWVQFGVDENGGPLYGYIGPRNPRYRFRGFEDLRDRWGR